jgi:hypothetical protein
LNTVVVTGKAGVRRVTNLANLGERVWKAARKEFDNAVDALQQQRLKKHVAERGDAAWSSSKDLGERLAISFQELGALVRDPARLP